MLRIVPSNCGLYNQVDRKPAPAQCYQIEFSTVIPLITLLCHRGQKGGKSIAKCVSSELVVGGKPDLFAGKLVNSCLTLVV